MISNAATSGTAVGAVQNGGSESRPAGLSAALASNKPTVGRSEVCDWAEVSRSKGYELMNNDPTFPPWFKAYESPRAPRIWWRTDVIAWLRQREQMSHSVAKRV